jgi:hypothetical protein
MHDDDTELPRGLARGQTAMLTPWRNRPGTANLAAKEIQKIPDFSHSGLPGAIVYAIRSAYAEACDLENAMNSLLPSLVLATAISPPGQAAPEMEKTFWDCEFAAVHSFVDLDIGAGCSENYEAIKKDKFKGNFRHFLNWWKTNKDREMEDRKSLAAPSRRQFKP